MIYRVADYGTGEIAGDRVPVIFLDKMTERPTGYGFSSCADSLIRHVSPADTGIPAEESKGRVLLLGLDFPEQVQDIERLLKSRGLTPVRGTTGLVVEYRK